MPKMRAKMQIGQITKFPGAVEQLQFHGVAAKAYPADGSDEDNTFSKWSPSVELKISITNPALIGQFKVGEKFYVDFTPAEA
jgi:hypothetical protein